MEPNKKKALNLFPKTRQLLGSTHNCKEHLTQFSHIGQSQRKGNRGSPCFWFVLWRGFWLIYINIYRKNLYYLCIECSLFCVLCFHHLTTCIVFDFLIYADWGSQIQSSTLGENWFEHIFSEVFHQAQWLNDDASPKHNKWPATFKSRVPLSIATPYSKWESNHIVKKYLKDDQFFPLPLPALACVFRSRICECVNQIWSWLQKQEHTPMFPDAPLL